MTKGPLLQTKWGQGEPWNTCVPYAYDNTQRCPTGCVAVAGSQMLYYLHYKLGMPETSWETGSCTGSSGEVIHNYHFSFGRRTSATWDTMATRFYQSSTATDLAAILMGYVGSKIGMDYTKDRSGADTKYLVGFFLGEGIQSNFTDYNSTDILGSLSNDMPVILSAKSTVHHVKFLGMTLYTWYEDGHAWVADGYERQQTKYTYYYEWLPADGANSPLKARPVDLMEQTYKTEESISTTNLLIMNWGWDGSADNGRYTLTGDWNATSTYNFVYNRKMIINFAKK
ncbi:MAG: hypothetical protein BGN96_08085 [Bacteroidales bacterium 45-6]|nr:MAG: hypothetical protein BGN96_08085 [Bacteroidales bacterium 45-6]